MLRKLKVYFLKHVLFIINAHAELACSRILLDFPKFVRKFKYKRGGSETAIAPFFSIYFIEFYQSWPVKGANKL